MAGYFVKNFGSRELAMQAKRDAKFPHLHRIGNQYFYMSLEPEDKYYTGMAPVNIEGKPELVLEEPHHLKIYRFIEHRNYDLDEVPSDHNYKHGFRFFKPQPQRVFTKGELNNVYWHTDKTFTDALVHAGIEYTRDSIGFALYRVTIRSWYREDGTLHEDTKISEKSYSNLEQIKEGSIRRGNLISGIQKPVIGMMVMTIMPQRPELTPGEIVVMGRDFMGKHTDAFTEYVNNANKKILDDLAVADDFWLDNPVGGGVTIRSFIINEMTI